MDLVVERPAVLTMCSYVDIEQMVSGRYGAIDWLPVMSTKTQQVYHARYHNCEPPRMIAMEPDSP